MRRRSILISLLFTLLAVGAVAGFKATIEGQSGGGPEGGLEEQLGAATGLVVKEGGVHWLREPAGGLAGAIFPEEAFFLASEGPGVPADLYRAEVRLADDGARVIKVTGLVNLTDSEAGDDYQMAASGSHVAVATRALSHVRSLTIFDLDGHRYRDDESWGRAQRLMASVTDLQRTGRARGVARRSVRFVHPPKDLEMQILDGEGEGALVLEWRSAEGERHLTQIDLSTGETRDEELEVHAEVRLPKRPILWLVDTVRAIPWIGPGPIEWAEGRFFALRDRYRRLVYELEGEEIADAADAGIPDPEPAVQDIELSEGLEVGVVDLSVSWPPPPIDPPVFSKKRAGEGVWRPAVPDFVKAREGAPPLVYETFVRSDIRRPYVRVHLLAMDMRQLELHMVAGHEDPRSTTGATGTGRIPDDKDLLSRIAIAFNGAFKTEHGAYGMMVDGNVLLPPQDDAATVATYEDGSVALGSWPEGQEIPGDMRSYRQNMDPLVEDGVVNPRRRYLWGFTLDSDIRNMNTIRSGVCMTGDGNLVYAWGEDLTATTLGIAMNAAGCGYGMHLDMNPFHTSFIFYRFGKDGEEPKRTDFESKLQFPEMRYSARRYVNGAPKDFFFLALKDTSPGGGHEWTHEDIAQPAPWFVPAVYEASIEGAKIVAVDVSRVGGDLLAGEIPESLAPAGMDEGACDDEDLLVEVSLGRWSSGRGQLVNGAVVSTLSSGEATLSIGPDGSPDISGWGAGPTPGQAVQGSWLLEGGTRADGAGEVVAISESCGWYYLFEGSWNRVLDAAEALGLKDVAAFGDDRVRVLVRTPEGMRDLEGEAVPARDPSLTSLRLLARPRHLGGRRM